MSKISFKENALAQDSQKSSSKEFLSHDCLSLDQSPFDHLPCDQLSFDQSSSDQLSKDRFWMRKAIELAKKAESLGEVPVGAVIVLENKLIGQGWNQPIRAHDPTAHAEIQAIRKAAKSMKNYRLPKTTLYVTLEPCLMCAGAMIHARIERLVFGAHDPKSVSRDEVFQLLQDSRLNHHVCFQAGILSEECGALLKDFFRRKRN